MADAVLRGLQFIINAVVNGFNMFIGFIAKAVNYVVYFFENLFFAIVLVFRLVVKVIVIFGKLGQYFLINVTGFLRVVVNWLTFNDFEGYGVPSSTADGLNVFLDLISKFGVLTVVPIVVTCFVWFFTVKSMIGLQGGARK